MEPSGGDSLGSLLGGCGLTSLNFGGENYIYIFGRKYGVLPPRKFLYVPKKGMISKGNSSSNHPFSGDMLVSGRVNFVFMVRNGCVIEVCEFSVVVDFHLIDGRKVSYSCFVSGFFASEI